MENAGLYVYLWSIYENMAQAVKVLTLSLGVVTILIYTFYIAHLLTYVDLKDCYKLPHKTITIAFVLMTIVNICMPKKEYLPYILSATPISKAIIESATDKDGKLNKIDKLLDMSLDKAIIEVEKTLKDK